MINMEDVNENTGGDITNVSGALSVLNILNENGTKSSSFNTLNDTLKEKVEEKPEVQMPSIKNPDNLFKVDEVPVEAPKAKEKAPAEVVAEDGDSAEEDLYIESPLFGGKKPLKVKEDEELELEGIDSVNEFIKKNFEGIEDFSTLTNKYKEINTKVSELSKVKEQYDNIAASISALPEELYTAIVKFEAGEDNWRESITNKPKFDLKADVSSIKKEDLINAYFPGEISEEEFEAADPNSDDYNSYAERLVKTKYEVAKQKFETEKSSKQGEAQRVMEQSKVKREKYEGSVKSSISALQNKFPEIDPNTVKAVESTLLKNGVGSLFYDKEGNLLPDAASNYVMAQYGYDLMGQYKKLAEQKARTEANTEILSRGAKTAPGLRNAGKVKGDVRPEVAQSIEQFKNLFIKQNGF
jgi:chaperonin cofactor prefoldin